MNWIEYFAFNWPELSMFEELNQKTPKYILLLDYFNEYFSLKRNRAECCLSFRVMGFIPLSWLLKEQMKKNPKMSIKQIQTQTHVSVYD